MNVSQDADCAAYSAVARVTTAVEDAAAEEAEAEEAREEAEESEEERPDLHQNWPFMCTSFDETVRNMALKISEASTGASYFCCNTEGAADGHHWVSIVFTVTMNGGGSGRAGVDAEHIGKRRCRRRADQARRQGGVGRGVADVDLASADEMEL